MGQLVIRIDTDTERAIEDLVADGRFATRSEVVRRALTELLDSIRRAETGRAIIEGYERVPETAEERAAAEASGRQLVLEEPW